MKPAVKDNEVKLEEDDSQPDTPTFGTIDYIFGDEYEDLMSMAEMKLLSNMENNKEEEAIEAAGKNKQQKVLLYSFQKENAPAPQLQKEQVIDMSLDGNDEIAGNTSKLQKSLRLLNIEEKPEPAPQPAKETREAERSLNASSVESQSYMTSTTLNGSRCGAIFNNTHEAVQIISPPCFDYFDIPSKHELKEQMAWKTEVFSTEEDKKRRRIRPLKYWIGESIRYMKANQAVIRYRKKIAQTFIHADDCSIIKASNTTIRGNTHTKGEITVPAHASVRLNCVFMARVNISQDYSLFICDNKLQIINERGKSSLVLRNCRLTELENTLDVDCTLHLKLYSEYG